MRQPKVIYVVMGDGQKLFCVTTLSKVAYYVVRNKPGYSAIRHLKPMSMNKARKLYPINRTFDV